MLPAYLSAGMTIIKNDEWGQAFKCKAWPVTPAHDRISSDIDGEDTGQRQQAVFNPLSAVFVTVASDSLLHKEKRGERSVIHNGNMK